MMIFVMNAKNEVCKSTKIIGIVNQKGGTGKTTTTFNLSATLSKLGKKVLVVDFDPQGHIAYAFGFRNQEHCTITTPLMQIMELDDQIDDIIVCHEKENVDLIFSDSSLTGFLTNYQGKTGQDLALKKYLQRYIGQYDYILIDSSPAVTTLFTSVLNVCDKLIIPVEATDLGVIGLGLMMRGYQTYPIIPQSKSGNHGGSDHKG